MSLLPLHLDPPDLHMPAPACSVCPGHVETARYGDVHVCPVCHTVWALDGTSGQPAAA